MSHQILEEAMFASMNAAGRRHCRDAANPLDILDNHHDLNQCYPPITPKGSGPLLELGVENCQSQTIATDIFKHPRSGVVTLGSKPTRAKGASQRLRHRKPLAPTTFEPPIPLQEHLAQGRGEDQATSPREAIGVEKAINSGFEVLQGWYLSGLL